MLKISNLIQKVDLFYDTAVKEYNFKRQAVLTPEGTWVSDPDDDEEDGPITERKPGNDASALYDQLISVLREVKDPNIQTECLLIGDMYRRAVELGNGFNFLKKSISTFIKLYLEENEDEEDLDTPLSRLEAALDDIYADAGTRAKAAGGGINKGDDPAAAKAIREAKDEFDKQNLETTLSGGRSTSDLSDFDPDAVAKFDMSGGVSMEEAAKGGRGYFVRTVKDLKDWIKSYDNERERYVEELANDKDPKAIEKKKRIIELLDQLKVGTAKLDTLTKSLTSNPQAEAKLDALKNELEKAKLSNNKEEASRLREEIKKNRHAVDPVTQGKIDALEDELKKWRAERAALKASLRKNMLELQSDRRTEELGKIRDPRDKLRLEQELLLLDTLKSQDRNKGEEVKMRKALLAFLSRGNPTTSEIGQRTYQTLLNKIDEASKKRIPIEQIWREQGEELVEIKGGGDFEAIFKRLEQHLPNIKMGDQKQVIDKWREQIILRANQEERTKFGPWLDAVAASRSTSKSSEAMMALYKKLNESVKEFKEKIAIVNDRMRLLEEQYRDVQTFKNKIKDLAKNNVAFSVKKGKNVSSVVVKPELNSQERAVIGELVNECKSLAARDYPNPFTGAERISTKPLLVELRSALQQYLRMGPTKPKAPAEPAPTVEQTDPDTGEITYLDPATNESYYKDIGPDGKVKFTNVKSASSRMRRLRIISGEKMNKKQRKNAFDALVKKSYLDTSVDSAGSDIMQIMADPSLAAIEDNNEYAHQVFQKMLAQMNEKMKKMNS